MSRLEKQIEKRRRSGGRRKSKAARARVFTTAGSRSEQRWARALVEQFTDAQLQGFLQTLPGGHRFWHNIYQVRTNPLNYFSAGDLKFLRKKAWETSNRLAQEAARQRRRARRTDREAVLRSEIMLLRTLERAFERSRRKAKHMEDCKVKADCAGKMVCSPQLKKCITNDEYELLGSVVQHARRRSRRLSPRSRRAATEQENVRRAVKASRCVPRDRSCKGESDPITLDDISVSSAVRVDKQCYDTAPLRKWLRGNPTLPHNRQPFSPSDLDECMRR
ncbi:MAG: hypothetical protein CL454_00430 [Acidimicrobiaceae bacterium]|nr:hypothetical protein [Acidimicrobiaceae bacterium]